MAERRMFAKTIIDSDAFLDMPMTSQCLYFHLGMRADDDGFVNNPKKVCRMVGASEDDLRVLISKRFLITFDTGVVVIKHWKMHNYIPKDRYKPTVYQEERTMLSLKGNNVYSLYTECIQNVDNLDTQERLGKDRLGKDRLGEVKEEPKASIDYQKIVTAFNNTCISYPKVKSISDARKKAIKARLNQYSEEDILQAFEKAEASDFMKGKNGRNWMANFDWIMKDSNMAKILDGNYDNSEMKPADKNSQYFALSDIDWSTL